MTDRRHVFRRPPPGALLRLGVLTLAAAVLAGPTMAAPATPLPGGYRIVASWPGADVQSPPGTWVEPAGVDVAIDGTTVVADTGNARVQIFGPDGRFAAALGRFGSAAGELIAPRDVAVTAERIAVTDPPTGRVVVWRRDGTLDAVWSGYGEPWGIAAAGDRFFVTDRARSELVVVSVSGDRQASWGREGTRGGEFRHPQGVAVAPNGEVYVADTGNNRLQVLSPQGRYRDDYPAQSPSGPPTDVAADGRGNVYLVGAGKVQWLEIDGARRINLVASLPVSEAVAVAVQPLNGVYVTRSASRLAVGDVVRLPYQVRGAPVNRTLGTYGGAMGRIVEPRRIVAGPDGSRVVLGAHSAASYHPDGRFDALLPSAPDDVVWLPGGDLVTLTDDRLSRLSPTGTVIWTWPNADAYPGPGGPDVRYAWLTHVVFDPTADRLYVLDVGNGLLLHFAPTGVLVASVPIASDGTLAAYRDMALRPDGLLALANPVSGQIELRTPEGVLRRAVPVPGAPRRIAQDAERAFVLTEEGWIWRLGPTLEAELAWPTPAGGRPLDLTAIDGTVAVLDGTRNQVDEWRYSPDAPPATIPPHPDDLRCAVATHAALDTVAVLTGEAVTIDLRLDGACPESTPQMDIVLVIDHSGSMLGEKLQAALSAAHVFLSQVDYQRSRVGLVAFSHDADLVQGLTDDAAALHAAVDSLAAIGGTDIAGGLLLAHGELNGPRHRAAARRTIVLLTDGNSDPRSAVGAALETKLAGTWLFTIGLGEDVNGLLLQRLASSPGDYYPAPKAEDLARVYLDIGRRIRADGLFRSVTLTHELPGGLTFAGMVAGPAPDVQGQRLMWTAAAVPFDGFGLKFRVIPSRPGFQAAALRAEVDYIDGLGRGGWADLAIPWFTALAPQVLPTPAPSATPGPWPALYLPLLARNQCTAARQHADVMLVLDTSTSMTETSGARTKLQAALSAAAVFADLLQLPDDQVGLVAFNASAIVAAPLGSTGAQLRAALVGAATAIGTRIDLGLDAAAAELLGPQHRPGNRRVVVLLTDGLPSQTTPEAVRARALAARSAGIEIFVIGLGADVDPALLADVATAPDHVYLAPGGDDLDHIYRAIAGIIPCR